MKFLNLGLFCFEYTHALHTRTWLQLASTPDFMIQTPTPLKPQPSVELAPPPIPALDVRPHGVRPTALRQPHHSADARPPGAYTRPLYGSTQALSVGSAVRVGVFFVST